MSGFLAAAFLSGCSCCSVSGAPRLTGEQGCPMSCSPAAYPACSAWQGPALASSVIRSDVQGLPLTAGSGSARCWAWPSPPGQHFARCQPLPGSSLLPPQGEKLTEAQLCVSFSTDGACTAQRHSEHLTVSHSHHTDPLPLAASQSTAVRLQLVPCLWKDAGEQLFFSSLFTSSSVK